MRNERSVRDIVAMTDSAIQSKSSKCFLRPNCRHEAARLGPAAAPHLSADNEHADEERHQGCTRSSKHASSHVFSSTLTGVGSFTVEAERICGRYAYGCSVHKLPRRIKIAGCPDERGFGCRRWSDFGLRHFMDFGRRAFAVHLHATTPRISTWR